MNKKTLLSDILWLFGWSVAYALTQTAWKFTANHFGFSYSETAVSFGFLLAIIIIRRNEEVELKKHLQDIAQILRRKLLWLKHYEELLSEETRAKMSAARRKYLAENISTSRTEAGSSQI